MIGVQSWSSVLSASVSNAWSFLRQDLTSPSQALLLYLRFFGGVFGWSLVRRCLVTNVLLEYNRNSVWICKLTSEQLWRSSHTQLCSFHSRSASVDDPKCWDRFLVRVLRIRTHRCWSFPNCLCGNVSLDLLHCYFLDSISYQLDLSWCSSRSVSRSIADAWMAIWSSSRSPICQISSRFHCH